MNKKQFKTNKVMITDIIQALSASGTYISGELFFGLAFCTEKNLKKICRELYIKVGK